MTQFEKECLALAALVDSRMLRERYTGRPGGFQSAGIAKAVGALCKMSYAELPISLESLVNELGLRTEESASWWRGYLEGVVESAEINGPDRYAQAFTACEELFGGNKCPVTLVVGI